MLNGTEKIMSKSATLAITLAITLLT